MGEAPIDHCGHGPMAPHLIGSKRAELPLTILVLLSKRKCTIWLRWRLVYALLCSRSKCHILICHNILRLQWWPGVLVISDLWVWSEARFLYTSDRGTVLPFSVIYNRRNVKVHISIITIRWSHCAGYFLPEFLV